MATFRPNNSVLISARTILLGYKNRHSSFVPVDDETCHEKRKKSGLTGIRTRVNGIRTHCDNQLHYKTLEAEVHYVIYIT